MSKQYKMLLINLIKGLAKTEPLSGSILVFSVYFLKLALLWILWMLWIWSWVHEISTRIKKLSPGSENLYTIKCSFKKNPGIPRISPGYPTLQGIFPGLENNHTLKCYCNTFQGMLKYDICGMTLKLWELQFNVWLIYNPGKIPCKVG